MTAALSKLNFRDLGGLSAASGGQVCRGRVFRSEGPANFFENHRRELSRVDFRTVCDLRSSRERALAPNDWCGPKCTVLNLDINTELRARRRKHWDRLRVEPTAENAQSMMIDIYRRLPHVLVAPMALIVGALLSEKAPLLIHCTAGKDRTGVTIALLLGLLGVAREDIVADYEKSAVFGTNIRAAGGFNEFLTKSFGFVPGEPVTAVLFEAQPEFVVAALEETTHRWGSIADYFVAAGVDYPAQHVLREMMLESHPRV